MSSDTHKDVSNTWQADEVIEPEYFDWLKQSYFSDPDCRLRLEVGDHLLREKQSNDRLFLVLSGRLLGYMNDPEGASYDLFSTGPDQFVGLLSFFSTKLNSHTNIIAVEPTEVAFIESDREPVPHDSASSLFDQFLPVVISNLAFRRRQEQRLAWEKESALRNLAESEKRASLGQMAAGIAHELNNAVAVLERNADWLSSVFQRLAEKESAAVRDAFLFGVANGRAVSSSDARSRAKELAAKFSLSRADARSFSETGFSDEVMTNLLSLDEGERRRALEYWDIGATIHSSRLASRHATHVVRSVRILGSRHTEMQGGVDINNSLEEAMALIRSSLRKVEVRTEFGELTPMTINSGELVQVWLNLIRNALESLESSSTPNPVVTISSEQDEHSVIVRIQDNGPGIPEELQEKVFKPNFSTKGEGLTFGLGLGLTICTTIVSSYNGKLHLESRPGCTIFSVQLPKQGRAG